MTNMMKGTLQEIDLRDIDFGQRYREDYGKDEELQEFAEDIKKVGLIHPVTVVDKQAIENKEELETISSNENARYLLMAGGRRVSAWTKFEIAPKIPAYVFPRILTADKIREIELHENIKRKDLNWQEKARMTNEFHRLQQKIHGVKHTSSQGGHSLQDTADMLGVSKGSIKNEIDLGKALEHIPSLAKIKSKSEALKVLREISKTDKAERKAKRVHEELQTKGLGGLKTEVINSFVVGDFFVHAEKLPPKTFDIIEIDPPYGIDLGNVKKDSKHKTLNYNEVPAKEYEAFMHRTLLYAKKLIKPGGWLIVWYAIDPWHAMVARLIKETGFEMSELPALWIKNGGQTKRPDLYFGSCYEPFFYARASKSSKINRQGAPNYLLHSKVPAEQKWHPTQRPISLMEDVLTRFASDGKVLVPFAGSGVTLRAASNLGMKAIGYDLSQDAKNKHDAYVHEQETLKFEL